MPWVNYGKKKPKAEQTWEIEAVAVCVEELGDLLKAKRAARWKSSYTPLPNGLILVVSEQRSDFAPKPVKVKKARTPKAAKPQPAETELTLEG